MEELEKFRTELREWKGECASKFKDSCLRDEGCRWVRDGSSPCTINEKREAQYQEWLARVGEDVYYAKERAKAREEAKIREEQAEERKKEKQASIDAIMSRPLSEIEKQYLFHRNQVLRQRQGLLPGYKKRYILKLE